MKSRDYIATACVLVLAIAVLCSACSASNKVSVEAKLAGWKFELQGSWSAENPTPKEVAGQNYGKIRFSKQEISSIFGSPGEFRVEIFAKLVGSESATIGTITGSGTTAYKDTTVDLEIYTVIRVVFKNGKLTDVRTWPKLERSEYSGGMWRIR